MKKVPMSARFMRYVIGFVLVLCSTCWLNGIDTVVLDAAEQSQENNLLFFDQLFPMSPAHQIIDMCMHVYEDLPLLKEMSSAAGYQALAADAMLGKTMRLDYNLQRVLKQNRVAGFDGIHVDDSLYLLELLNHIEEACVDMGIVTTHGSSLEVEQMDVKHMLHTIKVRLKQIANSPEGA